LQCSDPRRWSPSRQAPGRGWTGSMIRINLSSAIGNCGAARVLPSEATFNQFVLVDFLEGRNKHDRNQRTAGSAQPRRDGRQRRSPSAQPPPEVHIVKCSSFIRLTLTRRNHSPAGVIPRRSAAIYTRAGCGIRRALSALPAANGSCSGCKLRPKLGCTGVRCRGCPVLHVSTSSNEST
jgi:hypothetical protein